jgi:aromatic-L-amino-acid/L-tryptophan decarboxylase
VLVEKQVVKWCAELMGLPRDERGILVSGGTMANVLGARGRPAGARGLRRPHGGTAGRSPELLVYASTEVHGWLKKSCEFLGLGNTAFRGAG